MRFPDVGPIPPAMPLGRGTPFPPAPPLGGTVSFTRPRASGTATIDALMARQKAAAAQREAALSTPQTTLPGGIAQMLNSYLAGKDEYDAEQQEATGRAELTKLLSGYDPTAANAQAMAAQAMQYDPEVGMALISDLISSRRAKADQEQWTPIPTPEGENGQWFQNQEGDTKKVGGGSPGEGGWKPSDLGALRDDYIKLAGKYENAAPSWQSMQEAATLALDPSTTIEGKGAADYNMIVGFAKLLDPESVVREGEVQSASMTGGTLDQLNGYLNQWRSQGSLSDAVRRGIMTQASSRIKSYYDQAAAKRSWISQIAKDNKVNPEHVVPPLAPFTPWVADEAAADDDKY